MKHGLPDFAGVTSLRVVDDLRVEPEDIDFNGHMNVLVYLRVLTRTTIRGLEPWGLGDGYPAAHAYGLFSTDHHAQYLSELRLGDAYTTHLRLIGASDRAVHAVAYVVDSQRRTVATSLETVLVNVDHATRRAASFPEEIKEALVRGLEAANELQWDAKACGTCTLMGKPLLTGPRETAVVEPRA